VARLGSCVRGAAVHGDLGEQGCRARARSPQLGSSGTIAAAMFGRRVRYRHWGGGVQQPGAALPPSLLSATKWNTTSQSGFDRRRS